MSLYEACRQLSLSEIRAGISEDAYASGSEGYRLGYVQELDWSRDGIRLTVKVRDDKRPWYVTLESSETGRVTGICTCPSYRDHACAHIGAALITIANLVDETILPPARRPSADRKLLRERLAVELEAGSALMHRAEAREEKNQAIADSLRLCIEPGWGGESKVILRSGEKELSLHEITHFSALRANREALEKMLRASNFFYGDLITQMLDWAEAGREPRLEVMTDEGPIHVAGAEPHRALEAAYGFAIEDSGIYEERWLEPEAYRNRRFINLGKVILFTDTRTLACPDNPEVWQRQSNSKERVSVFPRDNSRQRLDERRVFPMVMEQGIWHTFVSQVPLKVGGEVVDARTVAPKATLCVDEQTDPDGNTRVYVHTRIYWGDMDPDSSAFIQPFLTHLETSLYSQTNYKAFGNRDTAYHNLLTITGRALWAEDQDALIDAQCLQRFRAAAAAERSPVAVRSLVRQTIGQQIALIPHAGGWDAVKLVYQEMARQLLLPLALVDGPVSYSPQEVGVFSDRAKLNTLLPALHAACSEAGMEITFRGTPVEKISIDLSIEAEDSDKEDWFELRPEIRADSFSLSDDEWVRLASGEAFLERDGRILILDKEGSDALAALRSLWDSTNGTKAGKPSFASTHLEIPRVQILDWAHLIRKGITLKLPAEEQAIVDSLLKTEAIRLVQPTSGLKATLRDYQIEGLSWLAFLYRHRFGACLADDMGLGKTIQAIALLLALKEGAIPQHRGSEDRPHIVVVPPSLVFNWRQEIERFAPTLTILDLQRGFDKEEVQAADVVIATYDRVRLDIETLNSIPFHVAIYDEAQAVKTRNSARSKAVRKIDARFTACLTGTPMENNPTEFHTILDLALPGLLGDPKAFSAELKSVDDPPSLRRARAFVLRRTKEHILKELPPKVETETRLTLEPRQKEMYTRIVAEVREDIADAYANRTQAQAGIVALSALTRLRQICVSPALLDPDYKELSPKLAHLVSCLEELGSEGRAALVFSQFTRTLDQIEKALAGTGITWLRLDGKTPGPARKKRVMEFQEPTGPKVFLISLKAGGVGLNLTRAEYVFHVDPWWNPAVENQASDRAHRMGQTETVFVQRLLMRHTIEEKIMLLKEKKRTLFDRIIAGGENRSGDNLVSRDDLDYLLDTTEMG